MRVEEIRDILTDELLAYKVDGKVVSKYDKKIKKWIKDGGKPTPAFLEKERQNYLKQIRKVNLKSMFYSSLSDGMLSKTLSGRVNCRLEDITNVKLLIDFMDLKNLSKIKFRMFDNSYKVITKNQVEELYNELISYYMNSRYHKWALDGIIEVSKNPQIIEWTNELKRRFPEETKEVKN